MKRKKLALLGAVLIFAGIVFYIWRVNTVRTTFSPFQSKTEIYAVGDTIDIGENYFDHIDEHPNGYQVTVNSCVVTTYGEYAARYQQSVDAEISDRPIYDVEVTFHNKNSTQGYIDLSRYAIQGSGMQEYQDFDMIRLSEPSLRAFPAFKLKIGHTKTFHLPFVFTTESVKDLPLDELGDLYLTISQYPIKKMIKLEFVSIES